MSAENVEVVRRLYDAVARRDTEAVLELYDSEIEWDGSRNRWSEVLPARATWKGIENLKNLFRTYYEMWESFDDEVEELIDAGDHVVAVVNSRGRGRESGLEVEWLGNAGLWTVRDGRIVRVVWFPTREEAMKAAGAAGPAVVSETLELPELVAQAFAAMNGGDLEGALTVVAEDVEFTSLIAEAEGTTFRGHDGLREWWRNIRGAFEDVSWDILEWPEPGDIGVIRFRMAGTLSGVPLQQEMWQVVQTRDGKVRWWAIFRTEQEAHEAMKARE